MRQPSRKLALLASLVLAGPLLANGCVATDSIGSGGVRDGGSGGARIVIGSGGTGGSRDSGMDGKLDAPGVEANPLCETFACFSACQRQIPVAPVEQPTGFVPVPAKSYAYETFPLGADMVLATGRSFAEIRKASDLSLVGSLPLPATWSYESTAVVGNTAVVRDGHANLAVLDLSNPAAPRATAWWFPWVGYPVGSWHGKLVLSTGHGVSFLDVSNPLAPVETLCLPSARAEFIAGDTLVGRGKGAEVYRLDAALNTGALWASIPLGDTRLYAMEGQRLVIPAAGGGGWDVGLYDLGGAAPVEVARHEQLHHPYLWSSAGFFYEAESTDLAKTIAYDMRGAFEPHSVSALAGAECLYRLDAMDGSAALVVSGWLPGMRFSPDAPPAVVCPAEDPIGEARGAGALSPDGRTLVVPSSAGWVFRDLDTGADAIMGGGPRYPDDVGWVQDRIVAVESLRGLENMISWATIYDAAAPQKEVGRIADLGLYTQWLGTSGGQMIGFGSGPVFQSSDYSLNLWLLDPHTATVVAKPLGLPTGTDYAGHLWQDKLVVLQGAEAIVFDLDGNAQGRITLPSFVAAAKTLLLAEPGWFAATETGEILRFDPAAATVEVAVTGCVWCTLLAADSERLYVRALGPGALAQLAPPPGTSPVDVINHYFNLGYAELRAYAITNGSYPLVGRYPLTEPSIGRLLVGSKLAVLGDGALLLAAPP
ncbi:MAG: hypothetical protein JXP73_11860 [Deltaproteobacteria bacterium]|nr:hypothetical protein [Deltaproteobacteria bacterium]